MQNPVQAQLIFNWPFFTRREASQLIAEVVNNCPETIDKFGYSEKVNKKWTNKSLAFATDGLADYPLYRTGELFLQTNKKHYLLHLQNPWNDLPCLYIYVDPHYLSKNSHSDSLINYVNTLCERLATIFARISSNEEHLHRHLTITPIDAGGHSEQIMGTSLKTGLPGIYSYTYFYNKLASHLNLEALDKVKITQLSTGTAIELTNTELNFENNNLDIADQVLQTLGAEYFFNKESAGSSKMIAAVEKSVGLLSNRIYNQLPNHGGTEFNSIKCSDDSLDDFYKKHGISLDNKYSDALLDQIQEIINAAYKAEPSVETIFLLGTYFGKLLAGQYKVRWDEQHPHLLNFNNYEPNQVNPFYIISLVLEDNLSLIDFDQYIQDILI